MIKERSGVLLLTAANQIPQWTVNGSEVSGFSIKWNICHNINELRIALSSQQYIALIIDDSIPSSQMLAVVNEESFKLPKIVLLTQANNDFICSLYDAGVAAVLQNNDDLQLTAWLKTCCQYSALKKENIAQQHYKEALKLLLDAVCKLSLARDITTVQKIVRYTARALNGADGATFVLRDEDRCYYADEDAIQPLWKGQRFPMSACISGWVMLNRKPVAIENIYEDSRIPADAYRPTFVKSLVMVPIRTEEPIGAIGNYWADHHVASTEEIGLIQALADSTAVAIENIQLYQELETRVEQRTKQLEALNRELESFSYSVSHDLRRPLRQIDGLAEAVLEDYKDVLDVSGVELLQTIRNNTQSMKQLIDNLLELARLGTQSLTQEPVDMGKQVSRVFNELNEQMGQSTKLTLGNLPTVHGDIALLKQVWINLLSNAIKYSSKRENPVVIVDCHSTEEEDTFFVRDNGAGFDASHAEKLFGIFQRFHSDKEFSGTGIGLSIVHRIITLHGGSVWAESEPDAGATFYFSLPRSHDISLA